MADSTASSGIDSAKIFVGGLSWQTTEETLRYHFEQFGPVVSVEVMRDRNTGDPRGFAFVVFEEDATVDLVMKEGRHEVDHKLVDVKRAQARGFAPPSIHPKGWMNKPSSESGGGSVSGDAGAGAGTGAEERTRETPEMLHNKVFVGGLPLHIDRDELGRHFSQFGKVVDSIVMMDPTHRRSRGFGFVTFEAGSGGAQRAMQSQPHSIQGKYVEIKLAQPKENAAGGGNQNRLRNDVVAAAPFQQKDGGKFYGLASAYARNGWKAGFGSKAFGKAGWNVPGWDDGGKVPEKSGFSFAMLDMSWNNATSGGNENFDTRETKRPRH